jgi:hypothetical protein
MDASNDNIAAANVFLEAFSTHAVVNLCKENIFISFPESEPERISLS